MHVAVTAPTGIAGLNIGGSTVHSFAGIGLGNGPVEGLITKILGSKKLSERWKETSVLVIDESKQIPSSHADRSSLNDNVVSMLDGVLFDKLVSILKYSIRRPEGGYMLLKEYIARIVRESRAPFGGIQVRGKLLWHTWKILQFFRKLVLSGDFFQLPPVPQKSHKFSMPSTFAFEARTWGQCIGTPVLLSRIFRQKDHGAMLSGIPERNSSMLSEFIDILSAMRTGKLTYNHISQLLCLSRPLTYSDGIEASQLYGRYLAYIPKFSLTSYIPAFHYGPRSNMAIISDLQNSKAVSKNTRLWTAAVMMSLGTP